MGGHPGGYPGGHPGGAGGYHHGGYYGGYRGGYYGGPFYGYGYGLGYGLGYPAGYGFGYGLAGYSYPIYGGIGPGGGGGLGLPYNTGYYAPPGPGIGGPGVGPGMAPGAIPPGPIPSGPIPSAPGTTPNPAPDQNKDLQVSATVPGTARLVVVVPEGGQVWFDNVLTPANGNRWVYTSPPLEPGRTYSVSLKARWGEGDQAKSYEIPVRVQAGDAMTIDLSRTR